MYSFWETVHGAQLADTLIRQLPKLSENSERIEDLIIRLDQLTASVDALTEMLKKAEV